MISWYQDPHKPHVFLRCMNVPLCSLSSLHQWGPPTGGGQIDSMSNSDFCKGQAAAVCVYDLAYSRIWRRWWGNSGALKTRRGLVWLSVYKCSSLHLFIPASSHCALIWFGNIRIGSMYQIWVKNTWGIHDSVSKTDSVGDKWNSK